MALPLDEVHPLPVEGGVRNGDCEQHAPEDERVAGLKGEKEGGTKAVAGDAWSTDIAATHPPIKDALLIIPTIAFVTCCGDGDRKNVPGQQKLVFPEGGEPRAYWPSAGIEIDAPRLPQKYCAPHKGR